MASNSFGKKFRITTFGESHGLAIGVVIDGCPSGVELKERDINQYLKLRSPGKNKYVTTRFEEDSAKIYSGVFSGRTTGAPITILIENQDVDSNKYEDIKHLFRPGHANYTYLKKYGIFDYRGGGRASARETACRVAAGAIAMKVLSNYGIQLVAFLRSVGYLTTKIDAESIKLDSLRSRIYRNPIYCPDQEIANLIMEEIIQIKQNGDSVGGVVEYLVSGLPVGIGDPVYEKLDANLAKAMLSIPGAKGIEIGDGFASTKMRGSEHNDLFIVQDGKITMKTNHAGGVLGGISTGMPLIGRVAFKPTASIMKSQATVSIKGEQSMLQLSTGARHDPCIAIRAVPVVEAMCSLVILDSLLMCSEASQTER